MNDINDALSKIRDDYAVCTPVDWTFEICDLSSVPWIAYQPDALGISFDVINADTQRIYLRDGEKWDNILYVVSPENWKAPNVGGWNLGTPRHGYSVEIINASTNPDWLHKIFAMEIAHSWNDMCMQELGDNLLSTFGVTDFDNQVIHGVDTRYGLNVPPNAPMTGYYTTYEYKPMIAIVKDTLGKMYKMRKTRYETNAYQFKRDLYLGLSGDDVIELQKRFAREGLATYDPTGYFGKLTKASAIAYQTKHGITPAEGYVGPKTRLSLNKTPIVTVNTPSHAEPEALLFSELSF